MEFVYSSRQLRKSYIEFYSQFAQKYVKNKCVFTQNIDGLNNFEKKFRFDKINFFYLNSKFKEKVVENRKIISSEKVLEIELKIEFTFVHTWRALYFQ